MSRSARRIDAVIFDLDDTILDWAKLDGNFGTVNQVHAGYLFDHLATAGFPLPTKDDFLQTFRNTVIESWRVAKQTWAGVRFERVVVGSLTAVGLDPNQLDMDELMQAYRWGPMPGVVPFADAEATLAALRKNGYKVGLVTNAMLPMWMRDIELAHYGLLDYFDARITSGDTGYMKPHPAIYWRVMGLLDTTPDRAVFVGDRPANDIAGANEVGMVSVLMSPDHLDMPLDGVEPHYTITKLGQLLPILEAFEK